MNLNINGRLKDARLYLGLSLEEVSKAVGIEHEDLANYEDGISILDAEKLTKLRKLYRHSNVYFTTGTISHEKKVELLPRTIDQLTKNDQENIIRFSEILSEIKRGVEKNDYE